MYVCYIYRVRDFSNRPQKSRWNRKKHKSLLPYVCNCINESAPIETLRYTARSIARLTFSNIGCADSALER